MALALGAGLAVGLLVVAFGSVAASVPGVPGSAGPMSAAAPAPPEIVTPATVVASTSCAAPDARDTVMVDAGGARRPVPLDACGSIVGSVVTVRVTDGAPARILGTGSADPVAADGTPAPSPMTARLEIVLTVVAGLGTAGLLVAIAHDRRRTPRRAVRRATGTRRPAGEPGRR